MNPSRLQVKYFVENSAAVDLGVFIGLFQRWIQLHTIKEMLIDVVDYRHVFDGPGVVLIGHESDFAMERVDGRVGLLYTRKRQQDATLQQLRAALRLALTASQLIEAAPSFKGKLKFRTDEVEIRLLDRLQLPNRPETLDIVRDDLKAVLADVYGSTPVTFAQKLDEPRDVFTVIAHADGAGDLASLLTQLKANEQLVKSS